MSEDGAALEGSPGAAPNPLEAWFRANTGRAVYKWPHYFGCLSPAPGPVPRAARSGWWSSACPMAGRCRCGGTTSAPSRRSSGVDNDLRCAGLTGDGITVVIGDQADRVFLADLRGRIGPVDVVIDDGGHSMGQQLATFGEMWPALKDGGVFIVEDVHTSYWPSCGGGYRKPGTFAEHVKDMIDRVHAFHSHDPGFCPDEWTRSVGGIHVYDSVIVFDKQLHGDPAPPEYTGTASF